MNVRLNINDLKSLGRATRRFTPVGILSLLLAMAVSCGPRYGAIKQGMAGKRNAEVIWKTDGGLSVNYDQRGETVLNKLYLKSVPIGSRLNGAIPTAVEELRKGFPNQKFFKKGAARNPSLIFEFDVQAGYDEKGTDLGRTPETMVYGQPPFKYELSVTILMTVIDAATKKKLGGDGVYVASVRSRHSAPYQRHQTLEQLLKSMPPASIMAQLKKDLRDRIGDFAVKVKNAKTEQ